MANKKQKGETKKAEAAPGEDTAPQEASAEKAAAKRDDEMRREKAEILQGKVRMHRRMDAERSKGLGIKFWESVPYIITHQELITPYSQFVFKRIRQNLAINVYLAEVYPSVATWKHWQDISYCITALVDEAFKTVEREYRNSERQAGKLMETIGLTEEDMPQYINTKMVTYAITTPRVKSYLQLLDRLDRQVMRLEALWMSGGGVDAKYVRHECLRLRSMLIKLAGRIFRHSDRVRNVLRGKISTHQLLREVQTELEEHQGRGLKEKAGDGSTLLLDGEEEITGPLVGGPETEGASEGEAKGDARDQENEAGPAVAHS